MILKLEIGTWSLKVNALEVSGLTRVRERLSQSLSAALGKGDNQNMMPPEIEDPSLKSGH